MGSLQKLGLYAEVHRNCVTALWLLKLLLLWHSWASSLPNASLMKSIIAFHASERNIMKLRNCQWNKSSSFSYSLLSFSTKRSTARAPFTNNKPKTVQKGRMQNVGCLMASVRQFLAVLLFVTSLASLPSSLPSFLPVPKTHNLSSVANSKLHSGVTLA